MIRTYARRRAERRRTADWAWHRETVILAVLDPRPTHAISARSVTDAVGGHLQDIEYAISALLSRGYIELIPPAADPRAPGGRGRCRFHLTPAGLAERQRRIGR